MNVYYYLREQTEEAGSSKQHTRGAKIRKAVDTAAVVPTDCVNSNLSRSRRTCSLRLAARGIMTNAHSTMGFLVWATRLSA